MYSFIYSKNNQEFILKYNFIYLRLYRSKVLHSFIEPGASIRFFGAYSCSFSNHFCLYVYVWLWVWVRVTQNNSRPKLVLSLFWCQNVWISNSKIWFSLTHGNLPNGFSNNELKLVQHFVRSRHKMTDQFQSILVLTNFWIFENISIFSDKCGFR